MNTTEKPPVDKKHNFNLHDELPEGIDDVELKINGFDSHTKSTFKEPSLYLSIAIVFVTSWLCLGKTPVIFWATFAAMSAVAIGVHIGAERFLFKSKPEHKVFAAPFEGVFVVTFGAILPGLALLGYGIYAIATAHSPNIAEEIGKMALLLFVPLSNFLCWAAIKRGYLVHPRVVGLMTGFSLGLSATWTCIFLKTIFGGLNDSACKFGWMLLLCTSPFLLFAATCLSLDLWNKTDKNIQRITTTFSVLGIMLAAAFVFTPVARVLWVQSLIDNARTASTENKVKAVSNLREVASDEDLRPAKHSLSGFALASLLIPNRGLSDSVEADKSLYFETTGDSILAESKQDEVKNESYKVPGLSLLKSQMSGNIDATTFSSSIDWTMSLKNSNPSDEEAACEIGLPKGAAVSRVTLWVNGVPQEAAFASTFAVKQAYQAVVSQKRDPLLVTMPTPDHVLVQCFPVSANTGEVKIRIGFKVPLRPINSTECALELPKILNSNFALPKRQWVNIKSHDSVARSIPGIDATRVADGYELSGVIKNQQEAATFMVRRSTPQTTIVVPDFYAHPARYIVEQLKEVTTPAPRKLAVVIDTSATLKNDVGDIEKALRAIPPGLNTKVYFAGAQSEDVQKSGGREFLPVTVEQAEKRLAFENFVGGHNNHETLRNAIENTAETAGGAVLWIHGPQPVSTPNEAALDLMHKVCLYDMQIENGPNAILPTFQTPDLSGIIALEKINHKSTIHDVKALASNLTMDKRNLAVQLSSTTVRPNGLLIEDTAASAQVSSLWAKEEIASLSANGAARDALAMGANYRIISPISGAVVLDGTKAYNQSGLKVPQYVPFSPLPVIRLGGGLVGAAVDPAFGQANEVGMLADFGYDTARNIARFITLASLIISIFVVTIYLRGRKEKTQGTLIRAALILVCAPFAVHLLGIYMINNFGGLGGGL